MKNYFVSHLPKGKWNKKITFPFKFIFSHYGFGSSCKYYKLFTFLSIDTEILTPWSSQVHPEAKPEDVQATEGC